VLHVAPTEMNFFEFHKKVHGASRMVANMLCEVLHLFGKESGWLNNYVSNLYLLLPV
jgi:hypothetical protein